MGLWAPGHLNLLMISCSKPSAWLPTGGCPGPTYCTWLGPSMLPGWGMRAHEQGKADLPIPTAIRPETLRPQDPTPCLE